MTDPSAPEPAAATRLRPGREALAGLLGAGAALVVIEIVALFDATGTSVTEAVQNRFIDEFAASLKDTAIALFGTADKAALQIGTTIVVLAIGALVGAWAAGRRWLVAAGFGGFAVLGIVAALDDPLASAPVSVVAAVLGAAAGIATTLLLARWWRGEGPPLLSVPSWAGPQPELSRRTVLASGGASALLLVVGATAARGARASYRSAASAVKRIIPAPVRTVATPTQPFEVAGISPYITPTADFYRIDTALRVPVVDADSWRLTITGLVDRDLELSYADLLARDLVEVPITIQCVSNEVGGDLIGTARWRGVPLAELLAEAGVQPGATQIMGESVDGFTAGFPVEAGTDGRDSLLAVAMNGQSLEPAHGFPARLIIPGLYGYVSATKWITQIRLTTFEDEQGYWVPRGWSADGPIKLQSRIDVPRPGDAVEPGPRAIGGVAWAPHTGIERVEVRVDDGPWEDAELGSVASVDTWVQWRVPWDATPGQHRIQARAVDVEGRVQTAEEAPPAPNGATGLHTVTVRVG